MIVDKGNKGTVSAAQRSPRLLHLTSRPHAPHDHTHLTSRRGAGAGAATPLHSSAAHAGLLQLTAPLARPQP
eukprot:scaffold123910_cov30-Phaeocystis_antarctica.AAC.1